MDARCLQPEDRPVLRPGADVGATATRRRREFKESIPYWGAAVQVDIEDMAGSVSAFDANGEEKWRWRNELPDGRVGARHGRRSGVRRCTPTGEFNALDARTGEIAVGVPVRKRPPQQPDDLQRRRKAVRRRAGRLGRLGSRAFLPGMLGAGHGSALIVFALPD